jgi:hypothetical protein
MDNHYASDSRVPQVAGDRDPFMSVAMGNALRVEELVASARGLVQRIDARFFGSPPAVSGNGNAQKEAHEPPFSVAFVNRSSRTINELEELCKDLEALSQRFGV